MYHTTNSEYGNSKPKWEQIETQRRPRVSVIKEKYVNPYLTKKAFEAHLQAVPTGHDLLNREPNSKGQFETTSKEAFGEYNPAEEQQFKKTYDEAVTIYNPKGGRVNFGRDTRFTQPIGLE